MNWKSRHEDESGWKGTRKYVAKDFAEYEDVVNVVVPRLGGMDMLETRAVELNDVCAEYTTPFTQLVLYNGKAAYTLRKRLKALIKEWNSRDKDIGLTWRVVVWGLDLFSSPCAGALKGDQPEFWIHVEFLSDRLLRENAQFRAAQREKEEMMAAKSV
ncbi:Hypothetical Protein FCC1311_078832 [Hondaea fermentalgiana]|uniref:Uncharacterized protein n=1 Tax=Hondaea fermentalgiana TaxID=2315210 RepID=A0A2R5GPE8_9STRA|nr:Hypothetical Protein FCC1311_078832 [Hondaea fermentalgiana]|eukprot:GBG31658.1 Hypothetical Protein FCC1311_078832 [Hondaea fermentalgiana]